MADETLFSGMVQGVSDFVKEALNQGYIHEIHLERGVMFVERRKEYPVAIVLVVTKTTTSLRDSFKNFADKFLVKYCKYLQETRTTVDSTIFEGTHALIAECFPFLPIYPAKG